MLWLLLSDRPVQYADARLKQKQSASAFPDGDGIPDGAPPSAGTRRHATVTISTTPPRKPKRLPWQWPQRGDSCFQVRVELSERVLHFRWLVALQRMEKSHGVDNT